jgi:selenium metabolism protein YedF
MKKSIDAKGLACPQPVILTRKAVASGEADEIEVTVDNDAAKENVSRFLKFAGSSEPRVTSSGMLHTITAAITPAMIDKIRGGDRPRAAETESRSSRQESYAGKTLFFSADQIGRGDEALGRLLVKGFLYTLSELDSPPKTLVFMNSGVRLAAEREETIELLRIIQGKGADLLVCGTCLDYFHLKESLGVGRVSNLYEIAEKFLAPTEVVTIS